MIPTQSIGARAMAPDRRILADTVGPEAERWLRAAGAARISRTQAERIAAAFQHLRSTPRDARVRAAYGALTAATDRLYAMLVGRLRIRVEWMDDPEPYPDPAALLADVRRGRLLIGTVAAPGARRHPLLSNARGGAYDRFRAVHDVVGHAALGVGFDRHGEYAAWLHYDRMLTDPRARQALATELHGEHSVLWTTGRYAEHKAVLLPDDLVRDSRTPRR